MLLIGSLAVAAANGWPPTRSYLTAVVHAGVLHPQDGVSSGFWKPRRRLAEEQRVVAEPTDSRTSQSR